MWADLDFNEKKRLKKKNKKNKNALANKDESSDDESSGNDEERGGDEDDFFQHTGNFLQNTDKKVKAKTALPKSTIEIKVCTDANKEEPHQARLKCVEFHPSARVLMTAGLGQKLSLFQVGFRT
jgi:U3 small nucleolar RNA-associated protein 18